MSTLRIVDAPLLPNVDGTEKIPTGGRGDYAISVDQIKDHIFQDIGKELVGLGNVDNTSDLDKPVSTAQQAALNLKADKTYVDTNFDLKADKTNVYTRSETSLALSKKADLVNGVVPENQIPSSFNDVLEFTTPNLPIVGESGKIYVTTDTNKTWRWATNKYVEISGWNPDSVSKRVTIPTYNSAADGVNPVTGVADSAYFNVRSSNDESYIDEYQNVGGVATPSGKSYPSAAVVRDIAKYTALPFVTGKAYGLHERVQLESGEIARSTVDESTNNPNTITTGWIKEVHTTNLRQFFVKGDGSDETAKLQGAIDFCLANGVDVIDAENLRIKTTGTIVINKAIKIINNLQIDCYHDQIGLLCRPTATNFNTNDVNGEVLNLDVSVFRHKYYDVPTAVGIQLWNCYAGVIRYNSANLHYDALQLRADRNSGTSYCTLYLGNIKSCSGGVLIKENYADGGWVTQNTFYDGNFGGGGSIRPYLRYHIMLDGTSFSHNSNNVFFRPALEGWMTHGVIARNTANNTILYPYIEMPNATYYWDIESTSQSFQITGGNGVAGPLAGDKWRDFGSYTRIQTTGFSGQGAFDYMNGTFYEYVDKFRPAREQVKPTASRGRVSVGFKTHKSITHSVAGGLTIDLAEADAFTITVSADLTSITFTNTDLVQPLEEKTITFAQTAADLVITPFSATIRGSFSNPLSRNNAQHVYTLQRMRYTVALGVVGCATNVDVNDAVTHSTAGALTLNFNLGDMITVTANADITSMSLQQTSSLKAGETRTVVFRQNSAGVTINAFTAAQLGQGKANPVSRPNGVDVYTLMRLASGSIICTSVYSS